MILFYCLNPVTVVTGDIRKHIFYPFAELFDIQITLLIYSLCTKCRIFKMEVYENSFGELSTAISTH